jgi:hypothetical protein
VSGFIKLQFLRSTFFSSTGTTNLLSTEQNSPNEPEFLLQQKNTTFLPLRSPSETTSPHPSNPSGTGKSFSQARGCLPSRNVKSEGLIGAHSTRINKSFSPHLGKETSSFMHLGPSLLS